MSSTNRDDFISFFPVWMPLTSFSCPVTLLRTSSTMLNRSGESSHLCYVPDLCKKAFSFSPLSMILAVGLSYMAFIMLYIIKTFCIKFVESFYYERMLNFEICFFCIY